MTLLNNTTIYSGVSTNSDPPYMQHVWIQFLASCGDSLEKRYYAANIMFELVDIVSPWSVVDDNASQPAAQA